MTTPHNHDLSSGLLGTEVPLNSPLITWKDGHTTILPAVYDDEQNNLCETVDIPIIEYLAKCPESTPHSRHVTHLSNHDLTTDTIEDVVGESLSRNKPVVIRGIGHHPVGEELTADFLDKHYAISPNRAVWIHDVKSRAIDHTKVTTAGVLKSVCESLRNPEKIQCVLDIPLAQISPPDTLRNLDHGLAHGWNHTSYDVEIKSNVHPENFTVKGWGLLHHAGFLTYPHHDAEGSLTWVRMDVGIKFWVVFRPINRRDDRKHLQDIAIKLGNFTQNEPWIRANCYAEVITLMPGDTLIIPPGQLHAVYTPVASFATGGHFYHHGCMHLTEISRYLDVVVGDCLTNQVLYYALETLRRMMIGIPRLSPRISLYRRSLLALCTMVMQGKQYRAKGGHQAAVADTETTALSTEIATAIASHLGVTKRKSASMLLYKGDQYERGNLVIRKKLDGVLARFTDL
ncbi:hypothetical protein BDR05DRAFT_1006297 [Suillus weaverae]|nr:hypothetical protein BDR05DRAFT_1006297 [Suillus weaverae]